MFTLKSTLDWNKGSFKDGIILDPFIGSGTTAIAALKTRRNYIGYDNNPEYLEVAEKRIKKLQEQLRFEFA